MWRDERYEYVIGVFLVVVVGLIAFVLYGELTGRWENEASGEEILYQGVPLDSHLLALDKEALEEAYKQHVMLLFSVWLKDDVNVVHRVNRGLANGRKAYHIAAQRIEEREKAK